MKGIYWRPTSVSRAALLLVALVALVAVAAVEALPTRVRQPHYDAKLRAAHLADRGFQVIREEKRRLGLATPPEVALADTGMLGVAFSKVTSNTGYLSAKQASINPNYAALVVHWLEDIGVSEGDLVAIGFSGSFPALNVCVYAAVETLGAEAVAVSSASASQWGANQPELLWIDMERVLMDAGVFRHRSIAASRGAIDDQGVGMAEDGRALIDQAIARNRLELIDAPTLALAIDARMEIYRRTAGGRPYRAYINVGGGSASVGTHVGKKLFAPGVNREPPREPTEVDSVMLRFVSLDVPVVHLTQIAELETRYGLAGDGAGVPAPGTGKVFVREQPNRWLALGGLAVVLALVGGVTRLDLGARLLAPRRTGQRSAEPMV